MIKLQLTNDFGGFHVEDLMYEGENLAVEGYNTVLDCAKNVLKADNRDVHTVTLKKGIELILTDIVREDLLFNVPIANYMTLSFKVNLNHFIKVTAYQVKFLKYVVRHNKDIGEVVPETDGDELNPQWEDFLNILLCQRDEEGQRPCEYCNEKCQDSWVQPAYEHYIDMQTYALPVLSEA